MIGPQHKTVVERIPFPEHDFAKRESLGGVVLLLCATAAVLWANSPLAPFYSAIRQIPLRIGLGDIVLEKSLLLWINDGLMTLFFLVVGLEIKREILVGELSTRERALLPVLGALGGMLLPALIYLVFNAKGPGSAGWAIPMATDIAFTMGVLALVGHRVPHGLRIFILGVAIVDDLGAVLVIAFFYTTQVSWGHLGVAGGCLLVLILINRAGIRHPLPYVVAGSCLWLAFLKSGIHPTVAGVLAAMAIPAKSRINMEEFQARSQYLLVELERSGCEGHRVFTNATCQAALVALEQACHHVETPLQRLEQALHPWVAFAIMPLFALVNAGVEIAGDLPSKVLHPVSLGVLLGLIVGKPGGILLFSCLAVRSGLARLPMGVGWKSVFGVSCLGGIGFTMSLFIDTLAFGETLEAELAKIGILSGSLVAGLLGYFLLKWIGLARR